MLNINIKQEIEIASLRATVTEKSKSPTYAQVLAAKSSGPPTSGGETDAAAPPGPAVVGSAGPAGQAPRMGHALLIYLRDPTNSPSTDIKIMLKKTL